VIGFLSMFIPFLAFGPSYAIGGAAAVFIYWTRSRRWVIPAAGAKIGAASGAFVFLIFAVVITSAYFYHPEGLRQVFSDSMSQLSARGYESQGAQQLIEMLNTSQGLGTLVAYLLAVLMILCVAGSLIGGALCAAYLRRRMH
jgi:hypothetical protein